MSLAFSAALHPQILLIRDHLCSKMGTDFSSIQPDHDIGDAGYHTANSKRQGRPVTQTYQRMKVPFVPLTMQLDELEHHLPLDNSMLDNSMLYVFVHTGIVVHCSLRERIVVFVFNVLI